MIYCFRSMTLQQDAELQSKKEQYAESLLEGFSEGGTLYGLPSGTQTMVMYYNKDIFDEKASSTRRKAGPGMNFWRRLKSLHMKKMERPYMDTDYPVLIFS